MKQNYGHYPSIHKKSKVSSWLAIILACIALPFAMLSIDLAHIISNTLMMIAMLDAMYLFGLMDADNAIYKSQGKQKEEK